MHAVGLCCSSYKLIVNAHLLFAHLLTHTKKFTILCFRGTPNHKTCYSNREFTSNSQSDNHNNKFSFLCLLHRGNLCTNQTEKLTIIISY